MSGRVLLVEGGGTHDVFDLVERTPGVVRVRTPFLFEVGEELKLRVEDAGTTTDLVARVRGHVKSGDSTVTELEVGEPAP
ncbi:MAG: hypothetical protein HOV81_19235 [Kofleriaceae bacterium]|nr:hypothetical protein [Kofleriaceae bacterium]